MPGFWDAAEKDVVGVKAVEVRKAITQYMPEQKLK